MQMSSPPQNQATTGGVINPGQAGAIQSGAGTQINYFGATSQPPTPSPQPLHSTPAPTPDFTGREQEIAALVTELAQAAGQGAAVAISGIRGLGGIGKSELAYAVAARLG